LYYQPCLRNTRPYCCCFVTFALLWPLKIFFEVPDYDDILLAPPLRSSSSQFPFQIFAAVIYGFRFPLLQKQRIQFSQKECKNPLCYEKKMYYVFALNIYKWIRTYVMLLVVGNISKGPRCTVSLYSKMSEKQFVPGECVLPQNKNVRTLVKQVSS
jgi:hypothetical protein